MSEWDDTAARRWVAALFSDAPKPRASAASDEPRLSNHVAREGDNTTPRPTRSDDVRQFVGDLFGIDENARGLNNSDWA